MANSYPSTPPMFRKFLTVQIEDISTAGQKYVVPGFRGKIRKIQSVINGAITVGDAVLTAKIGGTAVTNGVITVANSGSAAGVVDTATPSALEIFTEEQAIEIETDGGSTGTVEAVITLHVDPI